MTLMADWTDTTPLIERMLNELASFTGAGWEQEDDVTLVALQREKLTCAPVTLSDDEASDDGWQSLTAFQTPSAPGAEREVIAKVETALEPLNLPHKRIEQLKTAVAEATMNAMEHGSHYEADRPVDIEVRANPSAVSVRIRDTGGDQEIPEAHTPDIEAKLAELQTPRGWGLFLIKSLVDDMRVTSDGVYHTVELIINREGEHHASQSL
jgi:anti-sigma regulatory factor (Ser/Thr protein kinase)